MAAPIFTEDYTDCVSSYKGEGIHLRMGRYLRCLCEGLVS